MICAMRGWVLKRVDIVPGQPATVFFALGRETVSFRTRQFSVGRRSAKTAAFARFLAESGFGDVGELFRFLVSLPRDYYGPIPVEGLDLTYGESELEAIQ